jgi:DNA-binding PadR family transcriptional regulator
MNARNAVAALPLSAGVFHILLSLAEIDRHGYGISKEVEASTEGAIKLGPTTLYRTLRQLHADGWIEELEGADDQDPRRRSYRITPRGRRVAQAEAMRLAQSLRLAKSRNLLPASVRI